MPSLSKEQCTQIEACLSDMHGVLHLRCDDYLLHINNERHKNRIIVIVYVNGKILGKDTFIGLESTIDKMTEIAKRFYYVNKKTIKAPKIQGGASLFRGKKTPLTRMVSAVPWFPSTQKCIGHIKKHNPNIELLRRDDYINALKEAGHAT